LSFGAAARQIGLPLRAGLHTGEIEVRGRDIGGIAVHAAARVMAQSGSNEVLVSRVVTDLVEGAGLKFSERGSFDLKGPLIAVHKDSTQYRASPNLMSRTRTFFRTIAISVA
jgi:class 3 adenylate cyclase